MHARAIGVAVATTIGLAALATSLPSRAQGAIKPIEARIVNTPTQPVPVTVLSAPVPAGEGTREVYSSAYSLIFENNFRGCIGGSVPAGKRLVLEHLSAAAGGMGAAALSHVSIADQVPRIFIPAAGPVGSGMGAAGQSVRLYLDGPFLMCADANSNNTGFATVVLNGYLVNRP